jgi:hypothetical protein
VSLRIFVRRHRGWCIQRGSTEVGGGGEPAIYVVEDGSVVNAPWHHPTTPRPHKINVRSTPNLAADFVRDVDATVELMGRYLDVKGA